MSIQTEQRSIFPLNFIDVFIKTGIEITVLSYIWIYCISLFRSLLYVLSEDCIEQLFILCPPLSISMMEVRHVLQIVKQFKKMKWSRFVHFQIALKWSEETDLKWHPKQHLNYLDVCSCQMFLRTLKKLFKNTHWENNHDTKSENTPMEPLEWNSLW